MNTASTAAPVTPHRKRLLSSSVKCLGQSALLAAALLGLASGGRAQGIFDFGATAPVPGADDISQLTGGNDLGGNYYVDGKSPGQTFTTGSAPQGYTLQGLYIQERSSTAGGGQPGLSAYTLRIFSLTNSAAGTATLLATYISTNQMTFTQGNWMQWTGLTNGLLPNTVYGYSLNRNGSGWWQPNGNTGNPYAGGIAARFPTTTGALVQTIAGGDAAFNVGLVTNTAPLFYTPLAIAPSPNIYVGSRVTLRATALGAQPLAYDFQTDNGSANWSSLAASASSSYDLDTTGMTPGNYQFIVVVTNSYGSITSALVPMTLKAASGPIVVNDTTLTPASAGSGQAVVMSATIDGTLPIFYQWQYATDTSGAGLVDLPGATNATYTIASAQFANAGAYRVVASNPVAGGSVVHSSFATLTVRLPVILSIGAPGGPDPATGTPVSGSYDLAQLSTVGDVGQAGPGLNYYDNNGTKPGQTFTTGPHARGYSLGAIYYKCGGPVNDGNHGAGATYTLRIYSMTNAGAGRATLISTYTNQNVAPAIPNNVWAKWTGLTNVFLPNTNYAYSISAGSGFMHMGTASNSPSFYSGGELALLPTSSGNATFGSSHNADATFLVNLVPAGYPVAEDVSMSLTNGSTVFAGAPVTLNVSAIGDAIGYIWQTDNGSGGASFGDLPNSNTYQYGLDTASLIPGTYQFRVLVTTSFDTNLSSSLTLNVVAANILSASLSPTNSPTSPVFAGTPVTLSASVQGNNLAYLWQVDGGGGYSDLPSSNTNQLTIDTSAMTAGAYAYQLVVTNASGSVVSSALTLDLAAASGPVLLRGTTFSPSSVTFVGNSVLMTAAFTGSLPIGGYQWYFTANGGGTSAIADATHTSFTLTNAQFANAGAYFVTASNNPPGLGPTTANSASAMLYVALPPQTNTASAGLFDSGSGSPYVGPYDIAQLNYYEPSGGGAPPGINYYVDNSRPPGQTFRTGSTPPTPAGYPLGTLYVRHESGSGSPSAQTYTLRLYEVIGGTNAALLTSNISTNTLAVASGNWIRWEGLTNVLRPQTAYAFSLARNGSGYWKVSTDYNNSYADGESVLLPTEAGAMAYSTDDVYDAAFVVGLTPPTAPVEVVATAITPSSCYAGQTVTMSASFSGVRPMDYQWQFTDAGNVTSLIPGATNTTYIIPEVSGGQAGTYSLRASNALSGGSYVSSTPAPLTVLPTPETFVMNFSHPDYSGAGVIGSGATWNRINVSGGAATVNGTAVTIQKNTTMLADDGMTPLGIQFLTYETWEFGGGGGTVPLLNNWMLLQGTPGTALFPFTFSNCIPGVYNLVLYGANGTYTSGRTVFTVNGVSQTNINNGNNTAFAEGVNYARFYNIAVTNGVLRGDWSRPDTGEAAFNGAQLELAYAYDSPHLFIASQPASRASLTGTPASFSVVAQGPGQLFYQWRSNSVPIAGATSSTYSAYTGTAGVWSYEVIVTNDTGLSFVSEVATLTVHDPNNLVWRGYTADWDLISGNWSNLTTTADQVIYTPGDTALFDDTAASFSPVLGATLSPTSVTVSNPTQDYVLSGAGSLSGSMSLTKTGAGSLTISNKNSYTGGTTVNGGTLALAAGGGSGSISGTLNINPGGTVNLTAWDALGYNVGACVSTVNIFGGTLTNSGGNEGYSTTFNLTGGTLSSSGGAYHLAGASGVGINSLASATVSTISAPVTLRSSPVVISTAQGTAPGGIDLDISGAIGGGGNSITKSGPGTLSLSGVNTYNGLTTVSNGRLLVNGTLPGAVTVRPGAVLGGNGTIEGMVTVEADGTLGAGVGVGALTLNSSPVLGGTVVAEINGATPANDLIAMVGNPITYGGILVVSNTGGALMAGQNFTLFTATGHSGSFSSIVGSPGENLAYRFANGVLSVIATNPTNLSYSLSDSSMALSWPTDHLGWVLQTQISALNVGLSTNWVDVPGSASLTMTNLAVNPANPMMFFRLRAP